MLVRNKFRGRASGPFVSTGSLRTDGLHIPALSWGELHEKKGFSKRGTGCSNIRRSKFYEH